MQKYGQAAMIGGIIGIVIFVVIFASVIPTVANETAKTNSLANSSQLLVGANVTGAAASLHALVPLAFVAIGIIAVVRFVG